MVVGVAPSEGRAAESRGQGQTDLGAGRGAGRKLPKDVKYCVYAEDPETGIALQVKATSSKKVTLDGITGSGGRVTLKKQKAGTNYYVRAEKLEKKKGMSAPKETYGQRSSKAEFTGNNWRRKKSGT